MVMLLVQEPLVFVSTLPWNATSNTIFTYQCADHHSDESRKHQREESISVCLFIWKWDTLKD